MFVAAKPLIQIVEELKRDVHPPLYYTLTALWIRVLGDSELAVRSLSLLLFIVSIALVYRLSASTSADSQAGLQAAWLFGLSYIPIAHATNARSYMLLCTLSILSTYYMISIAGKQQVRMATVLGYLLTAFLGLLSHYAFAYVLVAHFFVVLLHFRGRMLLFVALFALVCMLFLMLWGNIFLLQWNFGMSIGGAWMEKTNVRTVLQLFTIPFGTTSTRLGLASTVFYALATLFPFLLKCNERRSLPSTGLSNAVWLTQLASLTLIPILLSYFKPNFLPSRQGIVAIPFFCLVIVHYWRQRLSWKLLLALFIVLSIGRLSMYSWIALRSYDITGTDKWIAQQIVEMAEPGDIVVLSDLSWCPVGYYLRKLDAFEKYVVLPFPSDIPEHAGWRNLSYYNGDAEIQILSQRIVRTPYKGKQNVVVALGGGQLYRELQNYLEKHYALVEKRDIPGAVMGRHPTFAYQILKFAPRVEQEAEKSSSQ